MAVCYSKEVGGNKTGEPLVAISLSGLWESNIGWKYNIKQQGNKFTWTVINRNQKASGTINTKKDIEVSWSDNDSKGTSVGSILEIDPQGKATFIEWDNGVFFQRIKTGT
jgi:hypothetical protein